METAASLVSRNSVRTPGLDQVMDSIDQTSQEETTHSSTGKTVGRITIDRTEMGSKVVHRTFQPLLADLLLLSRAGPAQMQERHNSLKARHHGLRQQQRPQALVQTLQTLSAHGHPQACKGDQQGLWGLPEDNSTGQCGLKCLRNPSAKSYKPATT